MRHALALSRTGQVWAWGNNSGGQLGDGTTTDRNTPALVRGVPFSQSIAAGDFFSLALGAQLWAWGYNAYGQLGDGTITQRESPLQINLQLRAVAASGVHAVGVATDGSVWTWGGNVCADRFTGQWDAHSANPGGSPDRRVRRG